MIKSYLIVKRDGWVQNFKLSVMLFRGERKKMIDHKCNLLKMMYLLNVFNL